MKRVAALVPAAELEGFTAWLHGRAIIHLTRITEELPDEYQPSVAMGMEARDALAAYEQVHAFCSTWLGAGKPFLENIFGARTVARISDLEAAAKKLDGAALLAEVNDLRKRRDDALQRLASLEKEVERLNVFRGIEMPLSHIAALSKVRVELGRVARRAQDELERGVPETLSVERLGGELFWFAYPDGDDDAQSYMTRLGVTREDIPGLDVSVSERRAELAIERSRLLEEVAAIEGECRQFATKADDVELALSYWQAEVHRLSSLEAVLDSGRIGVAHGYVAARECERFADEVCTRFSGEVIAEDPVPGEDVPVKLRTNSLLRPVSVLVNMYGLPDYFSVDPTPFIALTFLAFFGICYSDAVYGIALTLVSIGLMRKFRKNLGLRMFFQLFLYCGISTMVFGALLGTWAGDLYNPEYLGEGNFLLRIRNAIPHFDALNNSLLALVGVIAIGVVNQYYGIGLRMYRDIRYGRIADAIYDGLFWLLYLTGLILLVSTLFVTLPPTLYHSALVLAGGGAIGLVLTQGRKEETFFGKAITGVVSLYGILGTYGATGFMGDTLSYSRLMALGLTTGIVGQSFNILAGIAGSGGVALFILVVVFGHVFNFLMSIIGAFVHAARLILLEFFGRFYEAGGNAFVPFGYKSDRVEIATGD